MSASALVCRLVLRKRIVDSDIAQKCPHKPGLSHNSPTSPIVRQAFPTPEGDTLCVWRLDRLGRSLPHLIDTVRDLEDRGIGFRSLQEAIDTTTPDGRLVFHIFGSLAERDLIQERTRAGLTAARARGRLGGRPTVLTPAKAKQAQRMIADGTPLVEVASVVGVSRSTLYRQLRPAAHGPGRERSGLRRRDQAPRIPDGRRCPAPADVAPLRRAMRGLVLPG